jgi:hypothetical protein
MFGFDHRKSRPVTCQMLDLVEQGVLDKDNVIRDLLNFLSEDEVKQFARSNDYIPNAGDDTPDEDEADADEPTGG